MDLHRPRRLLGLFTRTKCSHQPPRSEASINAVESEEHSVQHSENDNMSIYSNSEVALVRIAEQRDIVVKELGLTKENLEAEKKLTHELNQRLIMKAISIDCQLTETEDRYKKTKAQLDAANRKNEELSTKVRALSRDNENLLKRTAALARRDQIQKATILTSNAEIIKLMSTIEAFQERFLMLADAVVTVNEKNSEDARLALAEKKVSEESDDRSSNNDTIAPNKSMTPFEKDNGIESSSRDDENESSSGKKLSQDELMKQLEEERRKEEKRREEEHKKVLSQWQAERNDLFKCIKKLKSNNSEIKSKFLQTLKKHQWKWHKDKEKLLKKIGDREVAMEEKDAEILLMKKTLADADLGDDFYPDKGGLSQADTFGTLTTMEDSLSTTSSSSSLTIAYSLTETSNNLSIKSRKNSNGAVKMLDMLGQPMTYNSDDNSYSVSSEYVDTPPRNNGSSKNTD